MAVNEDNLDVLIRSLKAHIVTLQNQARTAEGVLIGLRKIRQIDGANPTDADTGQVMTDTRRDEIYDKCLPVANEILGVSQ